MSYTYRGNHQGPDLFDTATKTGDELGSPYDAQLRAERDANFAYYYARGHHDHEIAEMMGCNSVTVGKWRARRGFRSNYDLLVVI